MGESGEWQRGGCEGCGEGERPQLGYWEGGVGEGQREGWDSESGEGDWERAEGGLRAEAESSENLEENRKSVRSRGSLQNNSSHCTAPWNLV